MPEQLPAPFDLSYTTSIDGRIVGKRNAIVAVQDWGFRYGWGVFETIRLTRGRPLFLALHLRRMQSSAAALLIEDDDQSAWWRRAIVKTIAKAGYQEGAINLYWTRGESPRFTGRRIVVVRPQGGPRPRRARMWIAPWRIEAGTPGVGAKTLCYLPYTFATLAAQASGFDEALLLNSKGHVADGSAASLFIIARGKLLTPLPSDGALPGITREIVLECARMMNVPVAGSPVRLIHIKRADGAFLTSSLRGITPLQAIGDQRIAATAEARRLIGRLRSAYRRAANADIASFSGF
jgi:branched-chain amino acid aminotransferase